MEDDILWTPALVEHRLIEAADVMKRLPPVRVQGYISSWPAILPEFSDLVGQEPTLPRCLAPAANAVTRMDQTLEWLRWLEVEDAKLVWSRAEGKPWKVLACRFGLSVRTAQRRRDYALNLIAWRLCGRVQPATWSRRLLMERAQFLSREM